MAVHQQVPVSESVTQVEFSVSSSEYPFVGVSTVDDCRAVLEEIVPRNHGTYAEFFTVSGVDPARVFDIADDHESADPTLLNDYGSGGLFEFEVSDDCPAVFLSEQGALPRQVFGMDGEGSIRAEIPPSEDASDIVESFLAAHPDTELVTKREQPYVTPMFGHRRFKHALEELLTDRQTEVLQAAHEAGYYEWPRGRTAEELAADLDISTTTLLKHLRAVERKFVAAFFEEPWFPAESDTDS